MDSISEKSEYLKNLTAVQHSPKNNRIDVK
jgi:hypothetical protein